MTFDISWGTIFTVAVTQIISTITTFYMLKFLNNVHSNGNVKEIRKKVTRAIKNASDNLDN